MQAAQQAVQLAHQGGDPRQSLKAKIKLASIYQQMGKTGAAIELLKDDLAFLKTVQPNRDYLAALVSQGAHYGLLGNLELGKDLIEQAIGIAKGLNDRYHHIAAATSLMFILNALGHNAQAAEVAEEALSLGHFEFSDALRTNLSHIYLALEQYQRAEHHLKHIIQHCLDPTFVTISRARLANLYHQTGQPHQAHSELAQAMAHLDQTQIGAAWVTVSVAVFGHGSEAQKQTMLDRLDGLDLTTLSQTDAEKLRTALGQYRPDHRLNQG
jgi:tetratricopeptide (TPR) repeat protein